MTQSANWMVFKPNGMIISWNLIVVFNLLSSLCFFCLLQVTEYGFNVNCCQVYKVSSVLHEVITTSYEKTWLICWCGISISYHSVVKKLLFHISMWIIHGNLGIAVTYFVFYMTVQCETSSGLIDP